MDYYITLDVRMKCSQCRASLISKEGYLQLSLIPKEGHYNSYYRLCPVCSRKIADGIINNLNDKNHEIKFEKEQKKMLLKKLL